MVETRSQRRQLRVIEGRDPSDFSDFECKSPPDRRKIRKKFKERKSKSYKCRFCKETFVRKSKRRVHERTHDRKWLCSACPESFDFLSDAAKHFTTVHLNKTDFYCNHQTSKNWHRKYHNH
ncbi:hypothetical protein ACTXT7_011340 [Hymenolepis weldensis]